VAVIEGIDEFSKTTILGYELFSGVPADLEESITGVFRPEVIYEWVATLTENLVWVGVILIVMYYLMVDWPSARNRFFNLVPDILKRDAYELFKRMRKIWNLYLRGQLSTMVILGLASGLAATALGLPASIVLGLAAAALGLVPSVGSSVFAAIAGLVALFSRSTGYGLPRFWYVVIVLAVFLSIHLFENYWLRPKVLGQGLNMHPAVILVSVLGAITLGGGLLALVIVPLISTVGVLLQYILRKLSDADPWEEDKDPIDIGEIIESENL
jgi:predicted PurR-regulated permease PerM